MILQINKRLVQEGSPTQNRTDYLDGVVRANSLGSYVMVETAGDEVFSLAFGEKDQSFTVDAAQEMHEYTITQVWLLNDSGKTLARLV